MGAGGSPAGKVIAGGARMELGTSEAPEEELELTVIAWGDLQGGAGQAQGALHQRLSDVSGRFMGRATTRWATISPPVPRLGDSSRAGGRTRTRDPQASSFPGVCHPAAPCGGERGASRGRYPRSREQQQQQRRQRAAPGSGQATPDRDQPFYETLHSFCTARRDWPRYGSAPRPAAAWRSASQLDGWPDKTASSPRPRGLELATSRSARRRSQSISACWRSGHPVAGRVVSRPGRGALRVGVEWTRPDGTA